MRGHIRERSPRHFAIILDIKDPATGKRKRRWHSFVGTKREAQDECARLITEMKGGSYQEPDKTTLAAFLERWLEYVKCRVAPTTFDRYALLVRKNIVPLLGATALTKLRADQIASAYASSLATGRQGRPFAANGPSYASGA